MNSKTRYHPVSAEERVRTLDFLRGFALFGIYLSIIGSYNTSILYIGDIYALWDDRLSQLDILYGTMQQTFINLRFIGLFSLLFSIGIAVQEKRSRYMGANFTPILIRRMLLLAVFGLINITFFFHAEILLVYSLFGLVAYALVKLHLRFAVVIAIFLFISWGMIFEVLFRDDVIASFSWFTQAYPFEIVVDIYRGTDFFATAKLRWIEYGLIYADNGFHISMSFGLIVLGYVAGIKDWHIFFINKIDNFKKPFGIALMVSSIGALYCLTTKDTFFIFKIPPLGWIFFVTFIASSLFVYIFVGVKIHLSRFGHSMLAKAIEKNGRLSLTGYMGGACLYSFIFYGQGLGLYVTLTPKVQLLIAIVCYICFTIFVSFWLSRFQQGPLEGLFRRIAYGRPRV